MNYLRTVRKSPGCPFYVFYFSRHENLFIPVHENYCGLREYLGKNKNQCMFEEKRKNPFFKECSIAEEFFRSNKNKKDVINSTVLVPFNKDSSNREFLPIVDFKRWFNHILRGYSLPERIDQNNQASRNQRP